MYPLRADVVIVDLAKLVLGNLAEIGGTSAKLATPAAVLPALPPDASIAGPMRAYKSSARSASIKFIAPLMML
jgi:hypothetical protein